MPKVKTPEFFFEPHELNELSKVFEADKIEEQKYLAGQFFVYLPNLRNIKNLLKASLSTISTRVTFSNITPIDTSVPKSDTT